MAAKSFRRSLSLLVIGWILCGQVFAQMNHSPSQVITKLLPGCEGFGLDCANAVTPLFLADNKLLLAWTANGVVSVGQSYDFGKTVTRTIKIAEHGKSLDVGSDARPQFIADKNGNIFLAYAFFKDSNWNAQINTTTSSDGGNSFTTPIALIQDSSSQRFPSALLRTDNSIFISWIDKRLVAHANQNDLKRLGASIAYSFSQDGGKTFQREQLANQSSCECCRISASLDPKNQPVIAYRAIFFESIRDQASQVISEKGPQAIRRVADDDWKTDACPHHGPSIAVSGSGKFHVAWYTQGSKRSGVFYANSDNQGITYSEPRKIGSDGANVSRPYLLARGELVWMAWKEFDGRNSMIYIKESIDDGRTWSISRMISKTNGYSDHPLLINQGDAVFLSWLTRADGYQLIQIEKKP